MFLPVVQFTPNSLNVSVRYMCTSFLTICVFLSDVQCTTNSPCVSFRCTVRFLSLCFCPLYSSLLTLRVFLPVAQFAPNTACFCPLYSSLQTLCFCPLCSSFPTVRVFLSVVHVTPLSVSVRCTVHSQLSVCFCPWYSLT